MLHSQQKQDSGQSEEEKQDYAAYLAFLVSMLIP